MKNLAILTASEAFVYPQDQIRLSLLSMSTVQDLIHNTFHFRTSAPTTPPPTFGPVEITNPPGLVYEWGEWSADDVTFPIRLLTIDQRRVVWQIAGFRSEHIEGLMNHLLAVCATSITEDGTTALGAWNKVQWYSELSFTLDVGIEAWKRTIPIFQLIEDALYRVIPTSQRTFPSINVFNCRADEPFPGEYRPWHGSRFNIALRQGTTVDEQTFYSSAPLKTADHIALIEKIEQYLQNNRF